MNVTTLWGCNIRDAQLVVLTSKLPQHVLQLEDALGAAALHCAYGGTLPVGVASSGSCALSVFKLL